ncbi:LysE family translocator [Rhodoplanes sp. TEM]|uniref:LysE family translocator n=1 Tax=Rhodoplanes tepidamans TaxID=200616 RepID=A0ABT5JHW9_RHOTP|nr:MULTISPECIES: LysE family translocator [Rhodoplanes]MDC7789309.1 LysE family translocator [Rhodoplanes tepidamans]MDC7986571.1 LysE family translocator [Rhodoplanes sp. TEM]MDQ0359073.1 RhtB (resistance to homoserine/threonine) family protein [Rhodoplanes tepidamans]
MSHTAEFLSLMAVFLVAAVTPGADFACVMRESVVHGRRAGILAAIGVGSAILVHVGYTVLGIGLIVAHSVVAFTIVKWVGAAYLVWLGVKSFRAPAPTLPDPGTHDPATRPAHRSLTIGALTNLLNPKATLFFVSLFSTIVSPKTPLALQFGYGVAMAVTLAAWFTIVAVFLTTGTARAAFARAGRWFNRATGLVLIGLGVRVALQRST